MLCGTNGLVELTARVLPWQYQRFWWRESLLSALSLACGLFRVQEVNFNRFPGAILIIVFSLVHASPSYLTFVRICSII